MATTRDLKQKKNPLDEAMRTCFICVINNEAVLKSVFREPEEKLTFSKAVDIATEVEAAKSPKQQRPKCSQNQRKSTRSKQRSSTITIRSHHHLPNNHPVHKHSVIVVERKAMQ